MPRAERRQLPARQPRQTPGIHSYFVGDVTLHEGRSPKPALTYVFPRAGILHDATVHCGECSDPDLTLMAYLYLNGELELAVRVNPGANLVVAANEMKQWDRVDLEIVSVEAPGGAYLADLNISFTYLPHG